MARQNASRTFAVTLSPARAAQALGLRPDVIYREINREGSMLPVYQLGVSRRILVKNLEAWVASWPLAQKRKALKRIKQREAPNGTT
jgi:hypothetical protein